MKASERTGKLTTSPAATPNAYTLAFRHDQEEAHPGYYAVTLDGA
jgi:hypothetical protein